MGEVGLKLFSVPFVVWFCMLRGAFWGQSGSCSVVARVGAVSSHNLVYRDVVIGMQWG